MAEEKKVGNNITLFRKCKFNWLIYLGADHLTCRFFCFVQNFFSDNTRVRIFIVFFHNLTLGYMTKTLNQINIFFLHQNQNIVFSNIGNQNIFLEKTHTPHLEVKWSVPYKSCQCRQTYYWEGETNSPPAYISHRCQLFVFYFSIRSSFEIKE